MGSVTFLYPLNLNFMQKTKKDNDLILRNPCYTQTNKTKVTRPFNRAWDPIKSLNTTNIYQILSFSCKIFSLKFLVNLAATKFA